MNDTFQSSTKAQTKLNQSPNPGLQDYRKKIFLFTKRKSLPLSKMI